MDRRKLVALCALGTLALSTAPALAQTPTWPQRSVRFIVPLGPGSGVDIRRAADRRQAFRQMGQAGRGREQAGRRRDRGDHGLHRRERRSHAPDGADLDLHRAPVPAREAALRREGARADRAGEQHGVAVGVPASLGINSIERSAQARQGRARQAEHGVGDRRERFRRGRASSSSRASTSRACPIATPCRRSTISPKGASSFTSPPTRSCGRRCRPGRSRCIAITNSERAPMIPDVPTAKEAGTSGALDRWADRPVRPEGACRRNCATRSRPT